MLFASLVGCRRQEEPAAGALRVDIFYATFRPGCMKLTATDKADESRGVTTDVEVNATVRSDTRTVAVFRQAGWSRDLVLRLEARERDCEGPVVASATQEAQVPETGLAAVEMDLRAEDLDGDNFITTAQGGTDCDDSRAAVYPGATEVCDGVDNNCAGGETDAVSTRRFFADGDGDGYGNPLAEVFACLRPAGAVDTGTDCDDADASAHPDQEEVLCDGRDEDCDGTKDDVWTPGLACTTSDGCAGAVSCRSGGTTGAACVATQSPSAWFVDEDGDGQAGTEVRSCTEPQGASSERTDCDESSRFAHDERTEVCDKLDNDCDGMKDEGAGLCSGFLWRSQGNLPDATAEWRAVAPYGAYEAATLWLAGNGGRLLHVAAGVSTAHTCAGEWRSAWARPSDGRVFLGSADGTLATLTTAGGACTVVQAPTTVNVNGLVGFESGATTTVFAVTSDGRVLRWEWTSPESHMLTEVTRLGANLRDIHGRAPDALVAVGALDSGSTSTREPRIFRTTPGSGEWVPETLPSSLPSGYLRGVHVLTPQLAYAVGDLGLVLERRGSTWHTLAAPAPVGGTTPDLRAVVAFGRTAVYALSNNDEVLLYDVDTGTWSPMLRSSNTLQALDGVDPRDIWAVGYKGSSLRWSKN